jgi:hypothetical protein
MHPIHPRPVHKHVYVYSAIIPPARQASIHSATEMSVQTLWKADSDMRVGASASLGTPGCDAFPLCSVSLLQVSRLAYSYVHRIDMYYYSLVWSRVRLGANSRNRASPSLARSTPSHGNAGEHSVYFVVRTKDILEKLHKYFCKL